MATPDDLGFVADEDIGFEPDDDVASSALQRLKEIAPPAKDVALPMSPLAATLKAMVEMPNQRLGGLTPWLMGKLGVTAQPVQRAGAPVVGGGETALNKLVNALPLGGVATDLGTAGSFLLAQKAGKAAPDAARMLSGLTGRLLPESLQPGPVPGPGAVLTPQALKELAALGEDTKEPEAGAVDTYRRLRDVRRARTEAGEEQNPLSALGGTAGGIGLGLFAPLPKFTPKGPGVGSRVWAGAKTGGAYGGLAGLTSGDADTAGGDFTSTALQGAGGLGLGGLLGGALPAAGAFGSRLVGGLVKPDEAAKALKAAGVKNLTLGQMNPTSALGSIESASQSVAGAGPAISAQREAAQESWRIAAANAVKPPGMDDLPQGTTVPDAMGKLGAAFDEIYDGIRGTKVPTLPVDRLLLRVSTPEAQFEALATDDAVQQASKFIQQQMSILPKSGTETTAGVLMKIRHNIREKIRGLMGGNQEKEKEVGRLLSMAESELTDGLEKSLPEDAARLLAATDRQYGKFKVLEDAVIKAKDPASGKGNFTPQRLDTSVADAMKKRGYAPEFARGGGGPLRDLAANAAHSFEDVKGTGWGAQLAGAAPFKYVTAPALAFANRSSVQPFFLGTMPWQQGARAVDSALQRYLSRLNTSPQTLAPQSLFEALRTAPQENP